MSLSGSLQKRLTPVGGNQDLVIVQVSSQIPSQNQEVKASLGTFPSPKDGVTGRDDKRTRKRKVGRSLGHNEGITTAGSGSRNVLPRPKQLRTHRPKRPE